MDIVAVINQKGGVGKTTTTVNLGAALAALGRSVLLLDLDPQANLGTHVGIDVNTVAPTIYDVLVRDVPLDKAMIETSEPRVWCVPSNIDLSAAELELVSMVGRETLLRDALEILGTQAPGRFDYVLLDCPPSLGVLTINALSAAKKVIVPLQAEFFALQGMAKLTEIIGLVQRRLNPDLQLTGIVACKVDRRTRLTQEVLEEVTRFFPDRMMKTMIRPNVKLAEAPSYGQTVLSYAPDSNGAADYLALAREFLGEDAEAVEAAPKASKSEDRQAPAWQNADGS
jgi:chromosome partitioning protein